MANNLTTTAPPRSWWPIGIIAVFAIFLAGCVAFVVFSRFHQVDLVTRDYYEQELRHQAQMERVARAQGVRAQLSIAYDAAGRRLILNLPPEHARQQPTGKIQLYRPSEAGLDRLVALAPDAAGLQSIGVADLAAGLWRIKLTWNVGGEEYYFDQNVVIPRLN